MKILLSPEKLLNSGIVANNLMNRERGIGGKNSYRKELGFDPIDFLIEKASQDGVAVWLDIGCGQGRALIETARLFEGKLNNNFAVRIVGLDLAGLFADFSVYGQDLQLLEMPVEKYQPEQKFDLITCVHGLHYIGDKLSVIKKAADWLRKGGFFAANLDRRNLKLSNREVSDRKIIDFLRKQKFTYENKKKLISLHGGREFETPFDFIGADDRASPNYTGQPAVDSYYAIL